MIDIQQLIETDKELLLSLNGSNSLFWDGVMWVVTQTSTWIPAMLVLLYVIVKNNRIKQSLLIVLALVLTVTFADQIASGLCKPYFARLRPTHDPELMSLVQVVHGYRGGLYGFISSHAANTFAVAMFVSLLIRNWRLTLMMFLWASIPSYSRIYLGVHYPGDILCGAVCGIAVASIMYAVYIWLRKFLGENIERRYSYKKEYDARDVATLHIILLLTYFYALVMGMIKVNSAGF